MPNQEKLLSERKRASKGLSKEEEAKKKRQPKHLIGFLMRQTIVKLFGFGDEKDASIVI